jgi:light-regulated signal transduction histidine kinase (bacteriophytochrome)
VKVAERTLQLETTNKELEAFTYSVSHDLRAPLRAINGFSQVLMEDHSENLDTEALEILDIIKKNATKMGQLVDDLLSFSKLGKTDLQKFKVDMNAVVQSVLQETDKSANPKAEVILHKLPPAVADNALMVQAWGNLISNALKFSAHNKNPRVEIGFEKSNGHNVYFIRDNGVGFDMKYYHKLFGVFQRLHKQDEFEGTGVGLAIVQRIVAKHDGKVWADSKLGEGTTFYFSLNNQ